MFAELAAARSASTSLTPSQQLPTGSLRLQHVSPDPRRNTSQETRLQRSHADDHALPSENDRSVLVDRFFTTVGVVLPFVDKTALMMADNKPIPRAILSLLNIVYAHASSTIDKWSSELFYRRALALLDERTLRGSSLELGEERPNTYSFDRSRLTQLKFKHCSSSVYTNRIINAPYQAGRIMQ